MRAWVTLLSTRLPTSSACLCSSLDVRAGFLMMDRRAQPILAMYNSAELQEQPPPPLALLPCPSRSSPTFQARSHLRAIIPDLPFALISPTNGRYLLCGCIFLSSSLLCWAQAFTGGPVLGLLQWVPHLPPAPRSQAPSTFLGLLVSLGLWGSPEGNDRERRGGALPWNLCRLAGPQQSFEGAPFHSAVS